MSIEIYNGTTLVQTIKKTLSASLTDKLSGERTLDFSVITPRSQRISPGMTAKHAGQYYSVVRVARAMSDGIPVSTVSCEHVSYKLNDEAYNLVTFVFEGTPTAGLTRLLSGTPFTVGVVEPTANVEVAFTEGTLNRRNAVMRFIDACGGEIEYDGYTINIRTHRGSVARKVLMDGENVTDVSVTLDSREEVSAYEISLFKMAELSAGDEVNITFTPLGISVDTRIISITYNPFYRYSVRVEVGDYVPNLLASTSTQLDKIKQEFRAADGQMNSHIETIDGDVSDLTQTVGGFDLRIQTAEGNVASLSLTVDGFDTRITDAEGNVSALSQTVSGFSTRITTVEGDVSSIEQTVNGITTRVTNAEGDISSIEQSLSGITTRVGTAEGNISSITQNVSSITTRVSSVEGNVSTISQNLSSITTRVSTAEGKITTITQNATSLTARVSDNETDISTVTQTANKITWLIASGTSSSNFTMTSRALSLMAASIDLTGYVTINSLKTSGSTVINGANITTGTISADRIDVSTIKISKLIIGTKTAIDSQSNTIYIGGDSSSNVFTNVFIKASTAINFTTWASTYDGLTIDMSNKQIRPNKDNYYSLGTSTYSFKELFSYQATIGDTYPVIINMSGSTRQLRPRTTNTSYPWYLGNSVNPFSYAYFTNMYAQVQAQLGTSTSAKVGFFGTTPIARKTVASSATVATLITALKAYGLIY